MRCFTGRSNVIVTNCSSRARLAGGSLKARLLLTYWSSCSVALPSMDTFTGCSFETSGKNPWICTRESAAFTANRKGGNSVNISRHIYARNAGDDARDIGKAVVDAQ